MVNHYSELFQGDVFSVTVIGCKSDIPAFEQIISEYPKVYCNLQQDIYQKTEYWLELYNENASKRNALYWLKRQVQADRVVCFGDNKNDIPMFQAADEGYAVSNACDELKVIATGTIPGNNQDGVALWLHNRLKSGI